MRSTLRSLGWRSAIERLVLRVFARIAPLVLIGCEPATEPLASPSNTPTDAAAVSNYALSFRRAYVRVPDKSDLDLRDTWTLEGWVYPRAAGNGVDQDIISKWDGVTDAAYILQIDRTGVLRLVTNNGATQSIMLSNTVLPNTAWRHVAATFNRGTVKLYIQGVLDRTFTGALTPISSTQPLAFGREGNYSGGTIDARLDEIRIWNIVRSATQISTWRKKRLAGTETGLVAYWRFNEGAGQVAHDATGRGHNGRLGTTTGPDSWDPTWTTSAAPVQ